MADPFTAVNPVMQYQLDHIQDTRVSSLYAAAAVCLPAAYITVFLRVLSRRLGDIRLGSDDWCIMFALVRTPSTLPVHEHSQADRENGLS